MPDNITPQTPGELLGEFKEIFRSDAVIEAGTAFAPRLSPLVLLDARQDTERSAMKRNCETGWSSMNAVSLREISRFVYKAATLHVILNHFWRRLLKSALIADPLDADSHTLALIILWLHQLMQPQFSRDRRMAKSVRGHTLPLGMPHPNELFSLYSPEEMSRAILSHWKEWPIFELETDELTEELFIRHVNQLNFSQLKGEAVPNFSLDNFIISSATVVFRPMLRRGVLDPMTTCMRHLSEYIWGVSSSTRDTDKKFLRPVILWKDTLPDLEALKQRNKGIWSLLVSTPEEIDYAMESSPIKFMDDVVPFILETVPRIDLLGVPRDGPDKKFELDDYILEMITA